MILITLKNERELTYKRSSDDDNIASQTASMNLFSIIMSLQDLYPLQVPTRAAERPSSGNKSEAMKTSRCSRANVTNQNTN